MSLEALREKYPWPAERPNVPTSRHGWFQEGSKKLLAERITEDTKVIVEIGAWVGQSALWLTGRAPHATVISIDHWKGSIEHTHAPDLEVRRLLPVLFETFCVNLWERRDVVIPMRTDSYSGLRELKDLGIEPDVIFIDADHSTRAVIRDATTAIDEFPDARVLGDDWLWDSVAAAVTLVARNKKLELITADNAWALERPRG